LLFNNSIDTTIPGHQPLESRHARSPFDPTLPIFSNHINHSISSSTDITVPFQDLPISLSWLLHTSLARFDKVQASTDMTSKHQPRSCQLTSRFKSFWLGVLSRTPEHHRYWFIQLQYLSSPSQWFQSDPSHPRIQDRHSPKTHTRAYC